LFEADLPTFSNISIGVRARHRNYPQRLFFGLGTDTSIDDRTSYRLVDSGLQLQAGYRALPWLEAGIRVGGFRTEISGGTLDDVPTTEEVFDETTAPGIEAQPNFVLGEIFAEVDYRDVPANARSGGFYGIRLAAYRDLDFGKFSFDRVDVEATQLFDFFDKRRVLVLHGRFSRSDPRAGNEVPFYLMPYLGGDDTTRGYFEYRFYDRNLVVVNAEFRWEAFAGLDMALFFDAGKVADELREIRLSDLKTSYGIGFRFSARNRFVFRLDIGTGGGEGTRVFFKFNNAF
jgi:outer membrane protein assembly factor BamA